MGQFKERLLKAFTGAQPVSAAAAVPATPRKRPYEIPRQIPYEIALNGTAEEIDIALASSAQYVGDKFVTGAVGAFEQGRPEAWQKLLNMQNKDIACQNSIQSVLGKSGSEKIKAFLGHLSEKDRQLWLEHMMFDAIEHTLRADALESVKKIVAAGADIHADEELALRCAAEKGMSDVVKYLYEQGADFKTAIFERKLRYIGTGRLEVYQQYLTGGDDNATVMAQLLQQVKELTAIIEKRIPQVTAPAPETAVKKPDGPAA